MKKRLLSIALAAAMLFALSSIALADDPETTATLEITEPDGWAVGSFVLGAPGFDFGDIEATLEEFDISSDDNELTIDATNREQSITVSISAFEIDDVPTMEGFAINLTGKITEESNTGKGETTGYATGKLSENDSFVITVDALDTIYSATIEFDAVLSVEEGTAGIAGDAVATITWEIGPVVE